nr:hypothetical protein GCM10020241_55400 [Streptoalloteichus tenebrarius]
MSVGVRFVSGSCSVREVVEWEPAHSGHLFDCPEWWAWRADTMGGGRCPTVSAGPVGFRPARPGKA